MENYNRIEDLKNYTVKKVKTIVLPFFFFAFSSIVLNFVRTRENLPVNLVLVLRGCVRNSFFADALWFLTCLFVTEIAFKIIKSIKLPNRKSFIVFTSFVFHFVAKNLMKPSPVVSPSWIYNIDSMFYYLVFFSLGYVIYPYLLKLFSLDANTKKLVFCILLVISSTYTVAVFLDKNEPLKILDSILILGDVILIFKTFILILFNLVLAKLLENANFLAKIGRETLYLCGNEYIIKSLLPYLLAKLGILISFESLLFVLVYNFFIIILLVKAFIPLEKRMFEFILERLFICKNIVLRKRKY